MSARMRSGLLVAALALFPSAGVAFATGSAAPAEQGKALFKQDCGSCHSIGGGDGVGPDLKGITEQAGGSDRATRFIADPDAEIASADPRVAALVTKFHGLKMPNLHLTPDQVAALVAYLKQHSVGGEPSGGAGGTTTPAAAGDAAAGKKLFAGATQLAHGGPACLSCHTIAGAGSLGGGRIGPDLTKAYSKYGGAKGVASVLTTLPFPRMVPLYRNHPLAKQEQADLTAYLATTDGRSRPSDRTWTIVAGGVGVGVFGLALAFVIWPRRRLVVRDRLVPPSTPIRRA